MTTRMKAFSVTRFAGQILVAAALLTGCEGDNLFRQLPTGGSSGTDAADPSVDIQSPTPDRRVAVQDSVLVQVRVSDNQTLRALELSGVALRGSASLGTAETVTRFETKLVEFAATPQVSDTVITRYLLPTPDSLTDDRVYIVARAVDASGNESADTVIISIGGPRVEVVSPVAGSQVRAGTSLSVRVSASDNAGTIRSVRLRATGAFAADTTVALDPALQAVDTAIALAVPGSATGDVHLSATAVTIANDSATSATVTVQVAAPIQDVQSPSVSFSATAPASAERDDSVTVRVVASDSTQVGSVGITVLPIHRLATSTDTLTTLRMTRTGERGTFTFALDQLDLPEPSDTSTLRLEITAFAADTAGNCGASTVPETSLAEQCLSIGGHTFGPRSGARWEILVVRGITVALSSPGDRVADLVSDGNRVFLSNIGHNRVDVLPVGAFEISGSISVGSRPWGMAFSPDRSRLYVANSGGTNISVVSPTSLSEVDRIQTPNIKLFDVTYSASEVTVGLYPQQVVAHDYSDRPQFIGVTQNENLIFSTRPTAAAADGTVRIYRTEQRRLEIVTDYAERRIGGKLLILNADSAFVVESDPEDLLQVCPRARSANPTIDGTLTETCFTGEITQVRDAIVAAGYDTEFHFNKDITEIGLSDTTFVAVSGDHSTVAFGEGARQHARVMVLVDSAGAGPTDPLFKHGEIQDLVGNTAERVIGLALNEDGSLGVARGSEAYYFSRDLRLQGVVGTGAPTGGVDMHPDNPTTARSFVSGIEENGLAYVDVVDSFHFRRVARIFMRDPVTGPIRAVEAGGLLKIYAVTDRGVVVIDVLTNDL